MHIIFRTALTAAKRNLGPGILLQSFALTLVLMYYFHAPTHALLLKIPHIQQQLRLIFPILATAFFGGFIPFLFQVARKKIPAGRYLAHLLFMLGFWAINGVLIHILYQVQSQLFGDQTSVLTIIKKVMVDQFGYSVLISAPFAALAMHWKCADFSFKKAKETFSRKQFLTELPSILLALWAVWIPTVSIVYCLPLALQFPLVNIVLCFWSLLLTALSTLHEKGTAE